MSEIKMFTRTEGAEKLGLVGCVHTIGYDDVCHLCAGRLREPKEKEKVIDGSTDFVRLEDGSVVFIEVLHFEDGMMSYPRASDYEKEVDDSKLIFTEHNLVNLGLVQQETIEFLWDVCKTARYYQEIGI